MGRGMRKDPDEVGRRSSTLAGSVLVLLGILLFVPAGEGKDPVAAKPCQPTRADSEGPFYKPGAPLRTSTGSGLVVRGRLLGNPDCKALPGGRIEWWQTDRRGRYDDQHPGIQNVDSEGSYRFYPDSPPVYSPPPPHIHFKAQAPGYRALTTQL